MRALKLRNANGDRDALPVNLSRLRLHLSKTLQLPHRPLRMRLRHGVERTVEPPPLSLDLTLKRAQILERVRHPHVSTATSQICSLFVPTLIHRSHAARKLRE